MQQSRFTITRDPEREKPLDIEFNSPIGLQKLTFLDSVDLADLVQVAQDRLKTLEQAEHDNN